MPVWLWKKDECGALSARSDVAACDKNQMHGRYLIVPESTYGSCHMPLTPRRITHGGRVYEELSGDRNEVTHTSTCGPIALEIFFQALRPPRKSAPHGSSHDETDHCVRFYRRGGDINLSGCSRGLYHTRGSRSISSRQGSNRLEWC